MTMQATWSVPLFHRGSPLGVLLCGDWHYLVRTEGQSWTLFRVTGRTHEESWLVSCDPTLPRGDDGTVPPAIREAILSALLAKQD